jgi:hypothetical protein
MVGKVLKKTRTKAHANRMAEVEQLLGTPQAAQAARIALFFGFTIGRDLELPNACGMDLERTLMLSHEMRWNRPFRPDEDVDVTVSLTEIIDKPDREIAIVETVFETPAKEEIQRQYSTFVEFKSSRV